MPLGRLGDDELARGLGERCARTGRDPGVLLADLLQLAAGHPQRAMFLAHLLWERLSPDTEPDPEDWTDTRARARDWVADEALGIWIALTAAQQAALREVVRHGSATLRTTSSRHPRSTLATAQRTLMRQGVIEVAPKPGPRNGLRYRVVDPLLGDWVQLPR